MFKQLFLDFANASGELFSARDKQRREPEPVSRLRPGSPQTPVRTPPDRNDYVQLNSQRVPICYRRNSRARRYLLRLDREGIVQVTIPYAGKLIEARDFIFSKRDWLLRQYEDFQLRDQVRQEAKKRSLVWFRGRLTPVVVFDRKGKKMLRIGTEEFSWSKNGGNSPRAQALHALHKLAGQELPERTREIARDLGITFNRVSVRNQRSRWGSCSSRGSISLNWRLVQTPRLVRDYIIIHELVHRKQMNHSVRFWKLVEEACPQYESAEAWLKEHGGQIMDE